MTSAPPFKFDGYVTTLSSIQGHGHRDLATRLGFNPEVLDAGFDVFVLCEAVGLNEFEWKDRTKYSDGWRYDPTINEYVQRRDELRAQIGKQSGYNEQASDLQLNAFMAEQCRRLNVRTGRHRIVKVRARGKVAAYPDSPVRTVPQWRLVVPKLFMPMR